MTTGRINQIASQTHVRCRATSGLANISAQFLPRDVGPSTEAGSAYGVPLGSSERDGPRRLVRASTSDLDLRGLGEEPPRRIHRAYVKVVF